MDSISVPSDFEDLYLLNLHGHLNHLSTKDKKISLLQSTFGSGKHWLSTSGRRLPTGDKSYDLTKPHQPRWDATGLSVKHDFTVIDLQEPSHLGSMRIGLPGRIQGQQDESGFEHRFWSREIKKVCRQSRSYVCYSETAFKQGGSSVTWKALLVDE
ncbi:hypothetical protein Tco_0728685 [Tanacetum coccineum]|uniref:Uncharacterized protein n=1 Tax=Tanacetum coccineum TaxID=301880 RepID=A0ABQ4YLT5_9ASTR